MADTWLVATTAALTGLVVAVAVRPVLRRLPEPVDQADKTAYRDLATPGFTVICALLAMAAQVLALLLLPAPAQPLWTVLATAGVLLAAIDARTTWLPLRLTYVAWVLMAVAVGLSALLGATMVGVLRTVAGAAIAGALYLFVWAITRGGFGFGDVRFAPLLGATTASQSWTLLIWGLTLGTMVGAVHGGFRLLRRRLGGFAYAPSMLTGSYLAVAALHLLLMARGP